MAEYRMSYVANADTDHIIVQHRVHVLSDPEFQKIVSQIRRELRLEPPEYVLWLGAKNNISIGSKQSLKPIESLAEKHCKRIAKLAADFALPLDDAVFFINGNEEAIEQGGPRQVKLAVDGDGINIRISNKASRQEVNTVITYIFKEIMPTFKNHKQKSKPPENYDLVYAVFRARSKGMKFSEIYELYRNGALPLYNRENKRYDEESLERYYRRYKPLGAR